MKLIFYFFFIRPFEHNNDKNDLGTNDNVFSEKNNQSENQTVVSESNSKTKCPDDENENLLENGDDDQVIEDGSDFVESESIQMDDVQTNKSVSTGKLNKRDVKVKKRSKGKSKTNSPLICQICDKEFTGEF